MPDPPTQSGSPPAEAGDEAPRSARQIAADLESLLAEEGYQDEPRQPAPVPSSDPGSLFEDDGAASASPPPAGVAPGQDRPSMAGGPPARTAAPPGEGSPPSLTTRPPNRQPGRSQAASAAPTTPARVDSRAIREERRQQDLQDFRGLDAKMTVTPLAVTIAEDRLTAVANRITSDDNYEAVLRAAQTAGVSWGLDHEAIRTAVNRASRGQGVRQVVVAHGQAPRVLAPPSVHYHLPAELLTPPPGTTQTDFDRLRQLLSGAHEDAFEAWKGTVCVVRPGDVLAERVKARIEAGVDVCGAPLSLQLAPAQPLMAGDRTSLADGGSRVLASTFGYAGLVDGAPTVLPALWMSEDRMRAVFVCLRPAGPFPVPSEEDLDELLRGGWIEFGVLARQVALVRQRLSRGQTLAATTPIALGRPAEDGTNAHIQHAFDSTAALTWGQLQSFWGADSADSLARAVAQLAAEGTARVTAFRDGAVVVEKTPATVGVAGRDIQGEEITPTQGEDIPLEIGDNLVLAEDRLRGLATCFGYAALKWDIQPALVSPLWTTPDKSAVYFVNLPQIAPPQFPTLEEITALLARDGVTHGFSPERWLESRQQLERGTLHDPLVLLAAGTAPQSGRDAVFEWVVEIPKTRAGKVLEDGTIDFRERSLTVVVRQGDLIGRLIPAVAGTPGTDLQGRPIPAPAAATTEVVTDSRVTARMGEDGVISFHAAVAGGVHSETKVYESKYRSQQRTHIAIYPVSSIEGDVDFSTGNVDFNGDVVIQGSVQPQFKVRATGSVSIGGYIETGACVTAGRDITVKRGVVGPSTSLVAGGDIVAQYVQDAALRAAGNVRVGSYVFNASVRAGGAVLVAGKAEGSSRAVVGGLIWAAKGVVARSVGSPYSTNTRIVVGIDPDYVGRAEQIRANAQACQEKQLKLLRAVGLESSEVPAVRQRLARCRTPQDKQAVLSCLKRVARIASIEQSLQDELAAIAQTQRRLAIKATVSVQARLFAGVELRLGEVGLTVPDDEDRITLGLVEEDGRLVVRRGAFRGHLR